jgi:hypothetical protein
MLQPRGGDGLDLESAAGSYCLAPAAIADTCRARHNAVACPDGAVGYADHSSGKP